MRRIVPAGTGGGYDADRLHEPAEIALHRAFALVNGLWTACAGLGEFVDAAAALVEPINEFLDVLVMTDEAEIKTRTPRPACGGSRSGAGVLDWLALGQPHEK